MSILKAIRNALPRQCHLCHLTIESNDITHNNISLVHSEQCYLWCKYCVNRLCQITSRCQRCGLPTLSATEQCGQCLSNPPPWDRLYCINDYKAPLKQYIQALKYQKQFWLAADLSALLAPTVIHPAPELIPVPLHWRRLLRRHFNQSDELAQHLARYWQVNGINCMVNNHVFIRNQATKQQQGLTKKDRIHNVRHAFKLHQKPLHRHIALVDDVVTTGSTLLPLCKALRRSKVETIDVYCLARTIEPKH